MTIRLPDNFHAKRAEVIVLDADDVLPATEQQLPARRRPSPLLAGTRIVGDIMSPVVEDKDWDALAARHADLRPAGVTATAACAQA